MSTTLNKFTAEEFRQMVDLYTATNAQLDLFIRRYEAKFKTDIEALDAGTVLDVRSDADGITREEIMTFMAILAGLQAAQPEGSNDSLLAMRIRPMRISE